LSGEAPDFGEGGDDGAVQRVDARIGGDDTPALRVWQGDRGAEKDAVDFDDP
jgi:hypothetical protein